MIKLFIISLLLCSQNVMSNEGEIKITINSYLKALSTQDLSSLKKLTTEKFYKSLTKNNNLKKSNGPTKDNFDFDIKVKKAERIKGRFFVNIKNKHSDHFGDYWFVLDMRAKSYIISEMRMIEE